MADPTWEESTDAAPNPTAPVPVAVPDPTWDDSRAAPEPKEPDMSAVKSDITSNLKATQPEPKAPPADGSLPTPADYTPPPVTPEKSVTDSVSEALQRGFNMSTTGLRMLGKVDDTPDPRNAQWYYGVAKAAGQMYGDIPEMLEGMVGGAAAGSAVPVVGTIAGGIAGSFALPAMVRKHLMDQYSKGDIQTFQDFYTRAGGMLLEGSKAATVGLATTAVGGKVGEGLAEAAYPAITQTAGRLAAEVVTMGNAGAVMDGHAPQADDFITAGALMVGLHAAGAGASFMSDHADRVSGKMRDIYEQTGVLPHNALADAKNDPYTHQEIISSNVAIPKKYESLVEEPPRPQPDPSTLLTPKDTTLYHGTGKDYDTYDPARSGGLIHLTDKENAERYAVGGGGGRGSLSPKNSYLINRDDGIVYDFDPDSKNFNPIGRGDSRIIDRNNLEPLKGNEPTIHYSELPDIDQESFEYIPKSARTIPYDISGKNILDTTSPAGLTVMANLKRKDRVSSDIIGAAKEDLSDSYGRSSTQFSSNFWGSSKFAQEGTPHAQGMKNISGQLSEMGYDGIHFNDDSHKTVAIFNPGPIEIKPQPDAEPLPPLSKSFSDPMGITVPENGPYEPEELPATASGSGGEEPPKLDQDVQEFQDRIQPSSGKSPEDTAGLYERTIRQLKPIDDMVKELGGDKLRPSQNPAILAQLHTGVLRKATYFIMPRGGAFDFKTLEDTGVRSLSDINSDAMKADPSNPKGFMTFEVAQQTIAEDARGRETGMNLDTAKKIVADGQDKYGDLAKEKSLWRNSVFKYLADSGVISQEHYDNALIANSEYVPMNRVLGDEAVASGGKGLTVKSPVRKRMGSDRIIQDPNESDIKNVINYVMQAEKNRVGQALVGLAQREGGESFLQEVPAKNRPIAIFGSDLDQMLKQSGGGGEMMGVDPDEKLGDVWRPADVRANPKTQIQVMFDGKPRVFDADPGIIRAFTGMDEGSRGIAINLASSIANTLRAGYTGLTPAFALTHTLRQQLGAAPIFSEHTTLPFVGLVQGVLEMNRMGPAMREFMKTGAGSDTIASATRDFIQAKDLYDLDQNHNTGVIDSRSNVIKSPLEAGFWSMKNMLATSEAARSLTKKVTDMSPIHKAIVNGDEGTRVTEFKKTLGDSTDIDSKLRAAMAARKVLADISQTGSAMGPLNRVTPFFNAATQNMAALAEAIKANPVRTMTLLGAYVTTPAMISYALNHDKEWWDKMEPWEKFGFLHFEVYGHIVKIPLGESGRLAAGLPIAVLDSIRQKNPGIIADWAKETLLGMVPSVTPIVKPSLEQWGNKSFLTGAPLIPKAMEENTPYPYQTKPTTSALATLYGRAAQHVPGLRDSSFSSPIIADNYGQSWGGAAYGLSNYLLDKGIYASGALPDPQRPENNWDQNPFVKSFFLSQDSISDENISTFETDAHKTQKYLNVAKTLAPKDPAAAEALINSSEYSEHALNIKGIQGAISAQSKVIRTVEANPNISPVDKKVIIDGAVKQMDAAAKQGNEILQQYRKAIRADQ